LTFVLYPSEGTGAATLYEDAGDGYEHLNGFYARRSITCEVESGKIRVTIGAQEGAFVPVRRQVRLELREIESEPDSVQLGNAPAAWRYDPDERRLMVDLRETSSSQVIDLSFS
jgi:alpha-glucosidase